MHDASEAYLLDLPKPIKEKIPGYGKIEAKLMKVIAKKFGFTYPKSEAVEMVDEMTLEQEWQELMLPGTSTRILVLNQVCWEPSIAKAGFLAMFKEIMEGNGGTH